jgi:hypothetical protein
MQRSAQTHLDLRHSAMGTASNSNIEILSVSNHSLSGLSAPWYINNPRIHGDLQMNTAKREIRKWSDKFLNKVENHSNGLAVTRLDNRENVLLLKRYTV